jgi:hypothetical protein
MKNKTQPLERPSFATPQLEKALQCAQYELQDRAFIPFFVLGQTLKSALDGALRGSKIELGVLQEQIDKPGTEKYDQVVRWVKDYIKKDKGYADTYGKITKGIEITPTEWTFSINDIPVTLQIIKGDYEFLKRLDFHFYKSLDALRIPNPKQAYFDFIAKGGVIE